ncbi:MAG: hypothetical protein KDD60_05970, partial [Bdellovibrionales bacterium]|nr:hypothetical protein [Bdellovibrionales bacterium]
MPTALPQVAISTASFWLCFESLPLIRQMEKWIERNLDSSESIDGFEFSVSHEALAQWANALTTRRDVLYGPYAGFSSSLIQKMLNCQSRTVHLPILTVQSPSHLRQITSQILSIYEHTGISEYLLHPDTIELQTWEYLTSKLPKELYLSVENMDCRKESFHSL